MNFSVAAPEANRLELIIFKANNQQEISQIVNLDKSHKSGDYWHAEIEGLSLGDCYGYRVFSSNEDNTFSKKILLDPCARGISGWDSYNRDRAIDDSDNTNQSLRSIVTERELFDFESHPRPRHSWEETSIYELHVGNFTNHPKSNIKNAKKGTFSALIEKIPHLKSLGITTIELLPVFAFDMLDAPPGLVNQWGYSPINWFTPHQRYSDELSNLSTRDQFRQLVAACHDCNLEVIIDVVYNHTTEGNKEGPAISWKGFGDSLYYFKNKKGDYLDVTGCGNTIAANRPIVTKLILESMICWAQELGVDGFRFDLGIALSRGEELSPLNKPPIFEAIEADPILSDLKLISEPWDCGGLYKISDFPAQRVRTWNGHFRDDIRMFWRGDKNIIWKLKDRLFGSKDIYKNNINSHIFSINFITSHDGFTLNDLVSFNKKHNLSNGEKNRDGENNNHSLNYGIEGPCLDEQINNLRKRQQKNMLASLLLSQGVPMISMGDEVSRSQGGNNNCWCQNTELGWMIWERDKCDNQLKDFVGLLLRLRHLIPEVYETRNSIKEIIPANDNETLWLQWHGVKPKSPDWSNWSHTISYSINKGNQGGLLWVGLNAYEKSMTFELPEAIDSWRKILDTGLSDTENESQLIGDKDLKRVLLKDRSIVVAACGEYSARLNR